jgi:hypothetical protein
VAGVLVVVKVLWVTYLEMVSLQNLLQQQLRRPHLLRNQQQQLVM